MKRCKKILTMLAATALGASVAYGSSPESPIKAKLEPVSGNRVPQGKHALRLTVTGRAAQDFDVEVKKPARELEVEARRIGRAKASDEPLEPKSLGRGMVSRTQPLVVDDALEAGPDGIVRARYELSLKSQEARFDGAIVVDQAFEVNPDGSLRPLDFVELMKKTSGQPPLPLGPDEIPAGAGSPNPAE